MTSPQSNAEAQTTTTQPAAPAELSFTEYERARRSGMSIDATTKSAPTVSKDHEQNTPSAKSDIAEKAVEEESEAKSASSGDDDESDDEIEQDKPRKKGGFQRRIDKLNARNSAAQAEIEHWKAMALKGAGEPAKKPDPKVDQAPASTDGKPNPDHFETHVEYVEALTDWKIEQREKTAKAKAQESELRNEQEKVLKSHSERVKSFADKTEDFQDVIESVDDIRISPAFQELIISSENGPELMYELAKNRAEYERIAKLPPLACARELGRIESKLSSPAQDDKGSELKKLTKAPKPLEPVAAGAAKVVKKAISDPDLSFSEYERLRREQTKRRRG